MFVSKPGEVGNRKENSINVTFRGGEEGRKTMSQGRYR